MSCQKHHIHQNVLKTVQKSAKFQKDNGDKVENMISQISVIEKGI